MRCGLVPALMEEVAQGSAGDVQRARRIRKGQTDVPHRGQGAALHWAGERIFEWICEKGAKQPHLFIAADRSPRLAFAGLWDRWKDPSPAIPSSRLLSLSLEIA